MDFVDRDKKYKFIDDLSLLSVINLVTTGISSYNSRRHVASDIGTHGNYLPSEKYQFSSRLFLENEKLVEITECKLLRVTLTNKLSFEKNTEVLVKRAFTRMLIFINLLTVWCPSNNNRTVVCSMAQLSD